MGKKINKFQKICKLVRLANPVTDLLAFEDIINCLLSAGKTMEQWIPSHCDLWGNEQADTFRI